MESGPKVLTDPYMGVFDKLNITPRATMLAMTEENTSGIPQFRVDVRSKFTNKLVEQKVFDVQTKRGALELMSDHMKSQLPAGPPTVEQKQATRIVELETEKNELSNTVDKLQSAQKKLVDRLDKLEAATTPPAAAPATAKPATAKK